MGHMPNPRRMPLFMVFHRGYTIMIPPLCPNYTPIIPSIVPPLYLYHPLYYVSYHPLYHPLYLHCTIHLLYNIIQQIIPTRSPFLSPQFTENASPTSPILKDARDSFDLWPLVGADRNAALRVNFGAAAFAYREARTEEMLKARQAAKKAR